MKRLLLSLLTLLAAAAIVWWAYPPARPLVARWLPMLQEKAAEAPGPAKKKGPPPAPVTAATAVLADMPVILSAPGTVEAAATVAVKPRVDGQIAEVLFKEGDLVEQGQVLFRLDGRLIQTQIQQAEANINRDRANLADAMATYERRSTLVQKRIVSESAMDTARTSVEALKAAIAAGQAALEAQRTLLDYLTIKAPIRGRTGATNAKPGSNVRSADAAPLVVINQTQPVSVAFAVPQGEIGALRRALVAGATAQITVPGTKPEMREGKIDFIDNQVDKQTGTLTAKIEVANTDELLWPGLAVEVALRVEVRPNMLSVPAAAVLPSQQGMIVWVIGADQRVSPRPVALERIVGQTAYLSSGLEAGERVVTDGQVRVAPGAPVTVQEPGRAPPAKGEGQTKSDKGDKSGKGRSQEGRRS